MAHCGTVFLLQEQSFNDGARQKFRVAYWAVLGFISIQRKDTNLGVNHSVEEVINSFKFFSAKGVLNGMH